MAQQKKQLCFILPLLAFLLAIGLFYTRLGKDTTIETNTSVNKPLPMLKLPSLGNPSEIVTHAQLPNEPYLVNVWASWCITCKVEHPFLMQMAKAGVPIVGIDYKDETKDALAYLNEHQDPYKISLVDKGDYGIDLGLTGTPESFVVDNKGNVRQHIIGEINEERYNQRVLPCMTALRSNADAAKVAEACH